MYSATHTRRRVYRPGGHTSYLHINKAIMKILNTRIFIHDFYNLVTNNILSWFIFLLEFFTKTLVAACMMVVALAGWRAVRRRMLGGRQPNLQLLKRATPPLASPAVSA